MMANVARSFPPIASVEKIGEITCPCIKNTVCKLTSQPCFIFPSNYVFVLLFLIYNLIEGFRIAIINSN